MRSDNGSQIISVYHSPRIRRASTVINHYYPDRTHSRRVPHSSPCLASRRSFIHARSLTVVPREGARGCLPIPPAIITSLYIIISQWTILFVNNLLALRGNNLKLRNHSRELITRIDNPRVRLLATSSPRPRCSLGILPPSATTEEEKEPLSFLIPFSLISLSIAGDDLREVDQCRSTFSGVSASTTTTTMRSWRELTGCLSLSYCESLRTDCYVFLSSNGPDHRSRLPTQRRYRSSSRVCFSVPPTDTFLVRHTGTLLSTRSVRCAPGILLTPLHTLFTLVLDFSFEG